MSASAVSFSFCVFRTTCMKVIPLSAPSPTPSLFLYTQMYGRYTQELGVYAKEEAARLRDGGVRDGGGLRRSTSVRSRAVDVQEYEKDPCAKCQCE